MFGGFLTDALSWRWLFFVNVPIALFAMFVTWREVDESAADEAERRIDFLGVITLSIAVVSILLALDEGTDAGFTSPAILALFVTAIVFFAAFALVERRQGAAALVPNDVLGNKIFAAACAAVLMMSAIFFSVLLYLPQFSTKDLGFSAVRSGAGLLPMMGVFAVSSFVAGTLYERLGAKLIVSLGAAFLGIGIFMLSFIETGASYVASAPNLAEGISLAFRVDAGLAVVGFVVAVVFVGGTKPAEGHPRHLHRHHRANA